MELVVGNARRSVPCCREVQNSNGFANLQGTESASVPYRALNSFTLQAVVVGL